MAMLLVLLLLLLALLLCGSCAHRLGCSSGAPQGCPQGSGRALGATWGSCTRMLYPPASAIPASGWRVGLSERGRSDNSRPGALCGGDLDGAEAQNVGLWRAPPGW
jgi:hypothetical protein